MKQNSQWLSQVRTLSNNAECTSTPSGSPARLSTSTSVSRPPRRISPASRASSTNCRHSSRSRGTSPLTDRISSPSTRPTRAAGEPGATATTRGADIDVGVYGFGGPTRRFAPRVGARRPRRYPGPVPVGKVLLAAPRGFCAGVEMAIKALAWMVRAFEPPVYCYHEIVHNRLVVDRFRDLGVVFVDDVDEVPDGAPLMLSAHGSAPEIVATARSRNRFVVNAVCPLVTKVHHEAKVRAEKGYTVLYVGHAGHDEAVGTLAVAPESMQLVEHEEDLDDVLPEVQDPSKVALLAQTTLSMRDWDGIMDRTREQFPELWTATRNDLCFATTNRQAALTAIATRAEAVVVIGSANSSNTIALTKVARSAGCPLVLRVDGPEELFVDELDGARVVGVTAGASAPEDLVQAVIAKLDPAEGVEPVYVTDEDEYFPPPRELRELVPALDGLAALMVGGDPVAARRRGGPFSDDRGMDASLVLAELAR